MTLAAFLDAGFPLGYLKRELNKLRVKGFTLKHDRVKRGHAQAIKFTVIEKDSRRRTLSEILRIIEKSRLDKEVKTLAGDIYKTLALAEVKVHRHKDADISFDELGRIDSLVDIVAAAIAVKYFKADKYLVSEIPVSSRVGPATLELLKGFKVRPVDYDYETITPTIYDEDEIIQLETNIDDISPQVFEYLQEELSRAGALEVCVQPVQMKKFRPGFLLTVLTVPASLDKVLGIIFKETTTFGVRYFPVRRKKIRREIKTLATRIGRCRIKIGSVNSALVTLSPEYEDCKRLARKSGLALRTVYDLIKNEGMKKWRSRV